MTVTSTVATPERTQFQTMPALSIRAAASEDRRGDEVERLIRTAHEGEL
jgi:hypothetical protein